jgi:hypothetical protein
MVPVHLVEQSGFYPLVLSLQVSQYGLANAKEDEDEDYGAEQLSNLKCIMEKFKMNVRVWNIFLKVLSKENPSLPN